MRILATTLFALTCVAGCTAFAHELLPTPQASAGPAPVKNEWIGFTPAEVVAQVSKLDPRPVATWFHFVVKGVGTEGTRVFLNSEKDYRDPMCLTIVLDEEQTQRMLAMLEVKRIEDLVGQHIAALGVARRVRVDFYANGRKTDKYYYQTHAFFVGEPKIRILSSQESVLLGTEREG